MGDLACWLATTCITCGRISERNDDETCEHCGARRDGLPSDAPAIVDATALGILESDRRVERRRAP